MVCDRGVVDRVDKSAEVKRAGGVGMVLVNLTDNTRTATCTACRPFTSTRPPSRDQGLCATGRSTRHAGPRPHHESTRSVPADRRVLLPRTLAGTGGDLLKPDIAAPGVTILAAVAPPSNSGRSFDFHSGTSMAAPHVAGLAALWFGAGVRPDLVADEGSSRR